MSKTLNTSLYKTQMPGAPQLQFIMCSSISDLEKSLTYAQDFVADMNSFLCSQENAFTEKFQSLKLDMAAAIKDSETTRKFAGVMATLISVEVQVDDVITHMLGAISTIQAHLQDLQEPIKTLSQSLISNEVPLPNALLRDDFLE